MNDIEKRSEQLILQAVGYQASDIHIVPGYISSKVQFRVDRQMVEITQISPSNAEKLISHFKFRAKMDIGEKRKPQNGSLAVTLKDQRINLRISTLPTLIHESLSIRLLPQEEMTETAQLCLFRNQVKVLQRLIKKAQGLILLSGPTGSGKTTTIYSLINHALLLDKRVISLEDPIEKKTDTFVQVELNEKAGLTYAEALKSVLRHDPDIIVIGEIRDEETAKIAVRAALTGHLVISTIHASNSVSCITRLEEFGIKRFELQETLVGVISQRLLELNCPICRERCEANCRKYRKVRRLGIFEVLIEQSLIDVLQNKSKVKPYPLLQAQMKKAMALGYVDVKEYERWFDNGEK